MNIGALGTILSQTGAGTATGGPDLSAYAPVGLGLNNPSGWGGSYGNALAAAGHPIDYQNGSIFYTDPASTVSTGTANRTSTISEGWSNPQWISQNTTAGTDKGQSGFWITPQNAQNPNFSLTETDSYRGPHEGDNGGVLGALSPVLDLASLAFPAIAPLAEGLSVYEGIQNKNPLELIGGLYGAGASAGVLPSPTSIWNSITGGGAPATTGTPTANPNFNDTTGGISGSTGFVPAQVNPITSFGTSAGLDAAGNPITNITESTPGAFDASSAASALDSFGAAPAIDSSGASFGGIPALGGTTAPSSPFSSFAQSIGLGDVSMPSWASGALDPSKWKAKDLFNLGTGAYGLYQGLQQQKLAKKLGAQADPFAGQRAQYGQQLQNLMANPSSIQGLPGYQAGLDAVNRSAAAAGQLGGGGGFLADSTYGSNLFTQQSGLLAGLAGANATPGAGAKTQLDALGGGNNMVGANLNRIGQTLFQ